MARLAPGPGSPLPVAAGRIPSVPGYAVAAEIHRSGSCVLHRAVRERDGLPVVLKSPVDEFPSPRVTAGLRREYELLSGLATAGVPRVYALESHRDRVALVLEDIPGPTLKELIARGELGLERSFDIARRLAVTLAELHRNGIIHKDVSPANVIVGQAGRVVLTDFRIATRLSAERQRHLQHPHLLEGTLAYMSPEQTGRMNRDLDYRSDLYSLGVTLYEMLTGRLPFETADPLELIHGHVAVAPVPPRERDPEVPPALSALVLKLLAKSAEDRYQSAEGVAADIERCRGAWERREPTGFALGQDDVRDRFVIPQRLYGRETEVRRLLEAFDRVAGGAGELVLVSGYSGIGKTSLIQEIHRSLARRGGHFVSGKFDQLARDVPYGALTQAFQALVRHLLAGTDEEVAAWRERVLGALGQQAQVLAEVIPSLARLLGPQPAPTPLGPVESQNRFNRVFQRFLGVFARPEHPLVLFLDDLQWADPATLTLLPLFLTNPDLSGLLVIGAYRDNEVTAIHPLAGVIAALADGGTALTRITLPPLDVAHVAALLDDTLGAAPEVTRPLAAVVLEKTGGNPFFVTQFLQSLHQGGQIAFDHANRSWRVDLAAIEQLKITENVVDLMADRIRRLGERSRRVLRLGACVGGRFDLQTLATISESEPSECLADLWPAVEQGLVLADEHSYGFVPDLSDGRAGQRRFHFLHDRVQQAAYDLIPETDRPRVHLAVGRLLLAGGEDPTRPEWLFDVAHHLNLGADLMDDPAERLGLAGLDLAAGRRAKASAAFPSAHALFAAGVELLPPEVWEQQHDLAFALHLERAEAEYLTGRFEAAQGSYATLLEHAVTALERVETYVLMMNQHETTARYGDAIVAGLAGLRLLGVPLPDDRNGQRAALRAAIATVRDGLAGRPVAALLELPRLQDATVRKAIKLLITLWAPAYISGEAALCHLVAARAVTLSLEHGNCEESAYGYVAFATTVGWELGDYAQALEFGQLGIALNERLADLRLRAKILHRFSALVNGWRRPFATSLPYAQEAVRVGQESGDLIIAAYAQFQQSWWGMHVEPDLESFLDRYGPSIDFLERMRALAYREVQQMILHWAHALRGSTESLASLTGPAFDERAYLAAFGLKGLFGSWYVTLKLELLVSAGEVEEARARAAEWEPVAEVFAGSVWPAMFAFWHALAVAAWLPGAPESARPEGLATLDRLVARLRVWAENAPENFGHLHHLAAAETERVRGDAPAAFQHYELALELAQRQTSPRHRALVNERYGEFWLGRGEARVAAVFLREARYGYSRWGAGAKVAQLERRNPGLLADAVAVHGAATDPGPLDLQTVVKVAQAVSAEIDLGRLLDRLIHVAVEHAGAERGHLVLEQGGVPVVRTDGGTPLAESRVVPQTLVNLVRRTGETLVLDDGAADTQFAVDPYFARERPRSVICTPVVNQGTRVGALYLENNLAPGVFTAGRAQLLQIIAAQAATAIENARLFAEIRRLQERLEAENVYLAEEIQTQRGFEEIVGRTPALQRALARVEQVAATDSTVLILGETGTGKELIARAIHGHSGRRDRPMVSVNCGAISPGLVESELFGHERGAFTGALARKIGRFELADGGTLFLDEIGDLPLELQVKLLRVLQEGEIQRVGGTQPIRVNVRVVAATHHDLEQAVAAGRFRADLYYRLNVFPIQVPPLRERRDDIPTLVRHFVLKYAARMGKQIDHVSKATLDALSAYHWPGNVRELANIVERSVIVSRGATLELGDWLAAEPAPPKTLKESERDQILAALEQSGWRVSGPRGAALKLGLKPTTLEARMKRLGIARPE